MVPHPLVAAVGQTGHRSEFVYFEVECSGQILPSKFPIRDLISYSCYTLRCVDY